MLKATLGPTMERLDMTFDSLDDYVAFWRKHPALADDWNDAIEAYVVYDYETTSDVYVALEREKQLKRWVRRKKTQLIDQDNPAWEDLAASWYTQE